MPKEVSDKGLTYSKRLRQKLLTGKDLNALAESGFIDKNAIDVLQRIKRAKPDTFNKDDRYRAIVQNQTSKAISEAMTSGNIDLLAHAVGGQSRSQSGYRAIKSFQNYIDAEGKVYMIDGNPNSGKTNMALFMAELWKDKRQGSVASNMTSCSGLDMTVESFNELENFLSIDGDVLFIFDDASNHASGYDTDREAMETKMRKMTNFIAKEQGVMIFIGHTGKDIHPDVRRKSRKIHKDSIKTADVYNDVDRNGDGINKKIHIGDVPKTSMTYDPYEKTEWDWNIESDSEKDEETEIKEEIRQLAQSGNTKIRTTDISHSNTKVADVFRAIKRGEIEMDVLTDYKLFLDESPKQFKKSVI